MTLGRPHTLLIDAAEFREDLDDEAQVVFEALWRRGAPQTFVALTAAEDAVDAALLFARGRGRFLRPSSRQVFDRALAAIERAGLAEVDRESDTGRVVELRMCATSAERAWMARAAARAALLTANDPPAPSAAAGAPEAPSAPTRRQRENLRTSITRWIERWRADHPDELRSDDALEAHYRAHVYSPGKPGRKPRVNGTQPAPSQGNDTRPAAANGTPAISSSLREGGERETLTLSPLSGESDARATPGPNDTQPNDTQVGCVSLPAELPPRCSEPAPPPMEPLDEGARLVALLREGAGRSLGTGSDARLGAALAAINLDPALIKADITHEELVREMGLTIGGKDGFPGQRTDEKGKPRAVFPVGLLLASRNGDDSRWLPSWVDATVEKIKDARRAARKAAEHEAAKRRPVAQQRFGTVGDNTVPLAGAGPPVAAPAGATRPGPSKSIAEMTPEERAQEIARARAAIGRPK